MSEINKQAILSRRVESLFSEEEASAGVPVEAVVSSPEAILALRDWVMLRAFHTRATSPSGMNLSRVFTATIKGFNERYGTTCKSWAQVAEVTKAVYALRDAADREAKGN